VTGDLGRLLGEPGDERLDLVAVGLVGVQRLLERFEIANDALGAGDVGVLEADFPVVDQLDRGGGSDAVDALFKGVLGGGETGRREISSWNCRDGSGSTRRCRGWLCGVSARRGRHGNVRKCSIGRVSG